MNYPWHKEANKIFTGVIIIQWLAAIIIGFFTDTLLIGATVGTLIVALPLILIKISPYSQITRHVVAIGTQLLAALHIQQAMGLTEMHFAIFTLLAFLSIYRDWKIIVTGVVVVAVHHFLFFALQGSVSGVYIFEDGRLTYGILAIHAFFAVAEGIVLVISARSFEMASKSGYVLGHSFDEIVGTGKICIGKSIEGDGKSIKDFNRLITSIRSLVVNLKSSGDNSKYLSDSLSESSEESMVRAKENQGEVEQIRVALEQVSLANAGVSKSVVDIDNLSQEASKGTNSAKSIIDRNSDDAKNLKSEINKASSSIENLSSMCNEIDTAMAAIKSISDQTNLLALNAAIESARAGEHGRGFAVVADEVRTLSVKTGQNAQEIGKITNKLLEGSIEAVAIMSACAKRVEDNVSGSNEASKSIGEINALIDRLSQNTSSVAASSEEQSMMSVTISGSAKKLSDLTNLQVKGVEGNLSQLMGLKGEIAGLHEELAKFEI
ncbi:MAG: methyl-accepting chemotaxis protein [Alphaproteobacteria bacterium]|jgi:methyl-accepting chemotaxis protein